MGMALTEHAVGERATVLLLVRDLNNRCPAREFLSGLQERDEKKFEISFGALAKLGHEYENGESFTALQHDGKPLWEFKEHELRLYCLRRQVGNSVYVVLLNGWSKRANRSRQQTRAIERAQSLRREAEPDLDDWLRKRGTIR